MRKMKNARPSKKHEGQTELPGAKATDLFAGLNAEQAEVVAFKDGAVRVLAFAGAGKTEAVARRVANLVANGVEPDRILAVTFSKKGGEEMTLRIAKKFGVAGARVGTWHALALQILKEEQTEYGSREIDSGTDRPMRAPYILKDILGFRQMDWKGADSAAIVRFIGRCKANLWTFDAPEAAAYALKTFGMQSRRVLEAYMRFDEELTRVRLLTYDDMLVFACKILTENEDARQRWAARWNYLIQDEAQDMNRAQKTLAELLARDHGNYMVVGDVFQAIYGFRGSVPEYLAQFEKDWPTARTIVLGRNYRCARTIIEAANNIIAPARIEGVDPAAKMIGERDLDGEVRVLRAESLDDEGNEVASRIQSSVASGETAFSDHTILYRLNAQSRAIEEALLARRIPYVVIGGSSFYERKEVKDLLAYLRLVDGRGTKDDVKRSINTPFRFLGARFVERVMDVFEASYDDVPAADVPWGAIVADAADEAGIQQRQKASASDWVRMLDRIRERVEEGEALDKEASRDLDEKSAARPTIILADIVRETRYLEWLTKEEGEESPDNSSVANVREVIRVAERFPTVGSLLDYIDETIASAKEQRRDKQAGGERVLLMTIHRSKGLEWPHVYVIGMNESILPHHKGDIEEERRLAYVAATRARDVLTMSFASRISTRGGIQVVLPSRFVIDSKVSLTGAPKVREKAEEAPESGFAIDPPPANGMHSTVDDDASAPNL